MQTKYRRPRRELKKINLDKLAGRKDTDFLLQFGGAEFVIQYRTENALREGHPFIDIVVAPEDPSILVDLCDDEGRAPADGGRCAQILLGMRTSLDASCPLEPQVKSKALADDLENMVSNLEDLLDDAKGLVEAARDNKNNKEGR